MERIFLPGLRPDRHSGGQHPFLLPEFSGPRLAASRPEVPMVWTEDDRRRQSAAQAEVQKREDGTVVRGQSGQNG
jgi:hypothetical protein